MNSTEKNHAKNNAEPDRPESADSVLPKVVKFNDLARCGEEIWIENEGKLYRLRRTRQGKLILTK
jgi:hemin uptake protein HemP